MHRLARYRSGRVELWITPCVVTMPPPRSTALIVPTNERLCGTQFAHFPKGGPTPAATKIGERDYDRPRAERLLYQCESVDGIVTEFGRSRVRERDRGAADRQRRRGLPGALQDGWRRARAHRDGSARVLRRRPDSCRPAVLLVAVVARPAGTRIARECIGPPDATHRRRSWAPARGARPSPRPRRSPPRPRRSASPPRRRRSRRRSASNRTRGNRPSNTRARAF